MAKTRKGVDCGQPVPLRKPYQQIAMNDRQRARRHDQTAIIALRECCDSAFDFAGITQADWAQFYSERWRHGLDGSELPGPGALRGIPNDRNSRHAWRNLLEQFQPFTAHAEFEIGKAGDVAARARQAIDKAGSDRISGLSEHDRYVAARLHQRCDDLTARGKYDVWRERDKFRSVSPILVGSARTPAVIDLQVAADNPAQFLEALLERRDTGLTFQFALGESQQHTNPPHLLGTRR
jgi:hypothetical protein